MLPLLLEMFSRPCSKDSLLFVIIWMSAEAVAELGLEMLRGERPIFPVDDRGTTRFPGRLLAPDPDELEFKDEAELFEDVEVGGVVAAAKESEENFVEAEEKEEALLIIILSLLALLIWIEGGFDKNIDEEIELISVVAVVSCVIG